MMVRSPLLPPPHTCSTAATSFVASSPSSWWPLHTNTNTENLPAASSAVKSAKLASLFAFSISLPSLLASLPSLPKSMRLATSSPGEGATARHVVLQALGDDGALVVGTATCSLKARQVAEDPRAELVARWGHLQVRARGRARLGDAAESDASWGRLPDGARLGLPALEQGEPVDDGAWADIARRVGGARRRAGAPGAPPPARPESFSALILEPETFEFYSGGHENYLNDRWLYVKRAGAWEKLRLQP